MPLKSSHMIIKKGISVAAIIESELVQLVNDTQGFEEVKLTS